MTNGNAVVMAKETAATAVDTQSWAIMPGDEKPESGVAEACAKQLSAKT
jgi:hypothetical protein